MYNALSLSQSPIFGSESGSMTLCDVKVILTQKEIIMKGWLKGEVPLSS